MIDVSTLSAFIGGLLTFFAPCTLPLIPAFIAFVSGQGIVQSNKPQSRKFIVVSAALFVVGFTVVFMLFGLASGSLGQFLILHKKIISQVGGVLIVLIGLGMLGLIPLPSLRAFAGGRIPSQVKRGTHTGSFLLGLLFGFGWSPCLGPILGTILILAGSTGSAIQGAYLLFIYALGLGLPFLLIAFAYGSATSYVTHIVRYTPVITKIGAILVIAIGILMVIGQFGVIASLGFDIYRIPALDHLMELM